MSLGLLFSFSLVSFALAQVDDTEKAPEDTTPVDVRDQTRDRADSFIKDRRANVRDNVQDQREDTRIRAQDRRETVRDNVPERQNNTRRRVQDELEQKTDKLNGRRQVIQDRLETKRAEIDERKAEIRQRITDRRSDLREDARERIRAYIARMEERFEAAINRLTRLRERIISRIEKLEERDVDLSRASAFLDTAETELLSAQADVGLFVSEAYQALDNEDDPRATFASLKAILSDAKSSLRSTHGALVNAVESIKSLDNNTSDRPNE